MVALLLAATSAGTGALAGLVGGAAAQVAGIAGPVAWVVLAAVVGITAGLDLAGVVPLSIRRQVPQLWGRIFPPATVAVLYGARLGVGPLTILRTWTWWGAFVLGALAGPWWSAGVGALFGGGRILVMLAAGTRAGAQRRLERWVAPALAVAAVAVAIGAWVGDASSDEVRPRAGAGSAAGSEAARRSDTTSGDAGAAGSADAPTSTQPAPVAPAPDQGLADALPDTVLPAFARVPDDPRRRLGPLDLSAAAAVEGDEPAERALLETRRFQRGHARAWRGPNGAVAHASVYVFASPADAEAYRVDGLTTIEARGARVYDLDAPAGARGFSQAGQAQAGAGSTVAHGVTFVRGDRFHLVFVTSKDSSVGPAEAAAAANAVASAAGG